MTTITQGAEVTINITGLVNIVSNDTPDNMYNIVRIYLDPIADEIVYKTEEI